MTDTPRTTDETEEAADQVFSALCGNLNALYEASYKGMKLTDDTSYIEMVKAQADARVKDLRDILRSALNNTA